MPCSSSYSALGKENQQQMKKPRNFTFKDTLILPSAEYDEEHAMSYKKRKQKQN